MNRLLLISFFLFKGLSLFSEKKLDEKIGHFFDKFNTVKNTSSSEFINSPQLGVNFLGSSGSMRTTVYDVNPIHIQLPSFSAGCGGIDYTLGGINVASKEEMKKALKSVASNGIAYAFLLGIETVSPVVASTMKQVQTWANQLNAININSCEMASSLVQGMWPKTQRASSYICEHASTSTPLFRDLIEAKHGCRDDQSKRQEAVKTVQTNNKDILVGNYNLAWKALENIEVDEETKNLFMNITGTIVVEESRGNKEERKVHVYPPNHKKAIELLRFGGMIEKAYKIEDDHIGIKIRKLEINAENAWKTRVYKILTNLQAKILSENKERNVTISDEEKNLISTTHFPIGSLLSLMAQYNGKGASIALDRYSDLIAFERVIKFAEEVARGTMNQAEALGAAQVSGFELNEYIKQVNGVLKDLQTLSTENYQRISEEHQVIDYLIKIDREIRNKERGV